MNMNYEDFKKEAMKYLPGDDLTPTEEDILQMRYYDGYTPEQAADNLKYGDWLEEYMEQVMEDY